MKPDNTIRPVEVFTGTTWETALLKSMLDDAEIESYFSNEITGSLNGGVPNPFLGGNITIVVSSNDYDVASRIVDEFVANNQGNGRSIELDED